MTIWNSPADLTGTSTADDAAKKDDKGNSVIAGFVFLSYLDVIKTKS